MLSALNEVHNLKEYYYTMILYPSTREFRSVLHLEISSLCYQMYTSVSSRFSMRMHFLSKSTVLIKGCTLSACDSFYVHVFDRQLLQCVVLSINNL